MAYAELFGWWIATISWSIAFPIAVSIYLYHRRKREKEEQEAPRPRGRLRWVQDFSFVWFLLGLLVFYVLVVGQRSALLFGVGNLVVEALLLAYVLRSSRTNTRRGQT